MAGGKDSNRHAPVIRLFPACHVPVARVIDGFSPRLPSRPCQLLASLRLFCFLFFVFLLSPSEHADRHGWQHQHQHQHHLYASTHARAVRNSDPFFWTCPPLFSTPLPSLPFLLPLDSALTSVRQLPLLHAAYTRATVGHVTRRDRDAEKRIKRVCASCLNAELFRPSPV